MLTLDVFDQFIIAVTVVGSFFVFSIMFSFIVGALIKLYLIQIVSNFVLRKIGIHLICAHT
jgi:hypothetical protein